MELLDRDNESDCVTEKYSEHQVGLLCVFHSKRDDITVLEPPLRIAVSQGENLVTGGSNATPEWKGDDPNLVAIKDPSLSEPHAILHIEGDECFIEDMGSLNGTRRIFSTNRRLRSNCKYEIHSGQNIFFGDVRTTFHLTPAHPGVMLNDRYAREEGSRKRLLPEGSFSGNAAVLGANAAGDRLDTESDETLTVPYATPPPLGMSPTSLHSGSDADSFNQQEERISAMPPAKGKNGDIRSSLTETVVEDGDTDEQRSDDEERNGEVEIAFSGVVEQGKSSNEEQLSKQRRLSVGKGVAVEEVPAEKMLAKSKTKRQSSAADLSEPTFMTSWLGRKSDVDAAGKHLEDASASTNDPLRNVAPVKRPANESTTRKGRNKEPRRPQYPSEDRPLSVDADAIVQGNKMDHGVVKDDPSASEPKSKRRDRKTPTPQISTGGSGPETLYGVDAVGQKRFVPDQPSEPSKKKRARDTPAGETANSSTRKTQDDSPAAAPFVLFTGCEPSEAQKNVMRKMGWKIVDCWGDKVTFVVADAVKRTVKFLAAVCSGTPIVVPAFITACGNANEVLDYQLFQLKDTSGEKKFSFSLLESLNKARCGGLILEGREVWVCPSIVMPPKNELAVILKAAGATPIFRAPRSRDRKHGCIVLGDVADANSLRPFPVLPMEALLDCCLTQKFDESRSFKV